MSGGAEHPAHEEQRAFICEIFHNLSQPLTALQCSLELSLLQDKTSEELRGSIEVALASAESLRRRLLQARELSDADDPGDCRRGANLRTILTALQEEMLPLFETAGVRWELSGAENCPTVRANQDKLSRALFRFLECLLRYSSSQESLCIRAYRRNDECVLDVSVAINSASEPGLDHAFEVELARRTLRATGGNLLRLPDAARRSVWRAIFPVA